VENDPAFMSVELAANRLGVPVAWLRREAEAGRVTVLHVGRKMLLNPAAIQQQLLSRAAWQDKPEAANA
jgi:excisionase family DNA binding protein